MVPGMKYNWWKRGWPLAVLLLAAVFAGPLAPWDPWEMTAPFLRPCWAHPLGTNDIGQDILSELIYGARTSLLVGVTASLAVTAFGSFYGACAAWFGGWTDRLMMALINVALAVPSLPLVIVLSAFLDRSVWNLILCICLTSWAGTARVVRARAMQLRETGFICSCRAMGCGPLYTILQHLLPNLKELIFTKGLLSAASAMLTETSVSYLGLGPLTSKSWGTILNDAFRSGGLFNGYWWWYLPPLACISLTVFSFLSLRGGSEQKG
ncbi:MAG: ABC transporter permease [Oscillibacter sp.]|nr:ABC transporter permease [Oscillibacter sp.]